MPAQRLHKSDPKLSLALAVVACSAAPLLLVDGDFKVIAASTSFCTAFHLPPAIVINRPIFQFATGDWDRPKLHALLDAIRSGATVDNYEIEFDSAWLGRRQVLLHAHRLDYDRADEIRLMVTVTDVTDARVAKTTNDDLLRDNAVLLQEVQHRVANSLQIIASIILQSARKTQSDEVRTHLREAHGRVMSVAEVQRRLTVSAIGQVDVNDYLTLLCNSLATSMIEDHERLSVIVTAEPHFVGASVSVSLGLVVAELVINALKHAFPDGRAGIIHVTYATHGAEWTLGVTDNGIGMAAGEARSESGMGTQIVAALCKQLHAQVEISPLNPGTAVSVRHAKLPLAAAITHDIAESVS